MLNIVRREWNRRRPPQVYRRRKPVPDSPAGRATKLRGNTQMNRRTFMTAAAAGAITPALTGLEAFAQSAGLPYDAISAIRAEGMGDKSQVMQTASYMMDVLGPRLSGSPGIRKSGE